MPWYFALILLAVAGVAWVLFLACGIPFLVSFAEGRRKEPYRNYDKNLLVAWSVDKGYSLGEYWNRTFHSGREKIHHGAKYTNRRRDNRTS